MKIILASESPFRRRALQMIGVSHETHPSRIDEKMLRDDDPERLTLKLARAKAEQVAKQYPEAIIVAGDAVAVKGNTIFEKPA